MNKGIKQAVFRYMDSLPESTLGAWDLFAAIKARTERKTMPSTLLQYVREYADIAGATFECIHPEESIYKYTPGYKIAGAILGGKE